MNSIWDWKEADKITTFSNTNSQNTYISSLSFVNQLEDTELLMTGASDGIIRVWSANYNEKTKANLVTAWRAHKQPNNSSGLVHIWNERAGAVVRFYPYLFLFYLLNNPLLDHCRRIPNHESLGY